MVSFYEWQLAFLVLACAAFLVLQRYVFAKPKAISQGVTQSEVAADLSRRYLCVYVLAMGMFLLRLFQLLETYAHFSRRCGLVTGTIHLLRLQRATRPTRTSSCPSVRPGLSDCRYIGSSRWCLGRPVVSRLIHSGNMNSRQSPSYAACSAQTTCGCECSM